jgi:hypothetical protein
VNKDRVKQAKVWPRKPERELESLIAEFDQRTAKLVQSALSRLRKQLRTAIEQVNYMYGHLSIRFCASEAISSCLLSLGASNRGVTLSFDNSLALPDPQSVLEVGFGMTRFIRIEDGETMERPEVRALLNETLRQSRLLLPAGGRGKTIIQEVSRTGLGPRIVTDTKAVSPNRGRKRT